jgi:hypothetical protein
LASSSTVTPKSAAPWPSCANNGDGDKLNSKANGTNRIKGACLNEDYSVQSLVLGCLSHLLNFAGGALAERIPPSAHGACCGPQWKFAPFRCEKRSLGYRSSKLQGLLSEFSDLADD